MLMQLRFAIMVLLSGLATCTFDDFRQFQTRYGKKYKTDTEEQQRYEIYKSNLDIIASYNKNPNFTFQLSMNKFGDITLEEFRQQFVSSNLTKSPQSTFKLRQVQVGNVSDFVDWATVGAISFVDQEQCRSNYALISSAAIQSAWAIRNGELIPPSAQQIMDCTRSASSIGCFQGDIPSALTYAMTGPGLCSSDTYIYNGRASDSCHDDHCQSLVRVKSFRYLPSGNELQLQMAVFTQPIISYISIDDPGIMFYCSGVYNGPCSSTPTHAVIIVGYGDDADTDEPYWKVGNTWGDGWGDQGYIKMKRSFMLDSPGTCGIADSPIYIRTY